ncbi:hypothetical protein DL98DRAFT_591026 [Cadophora sp. DSE1049]|nr:hypothetical protein DL98DRAFT_591026 [Cadophora sp. DSE1049]
MESDDLQDGELQRPMDTSSERSYQLGPTEEEPHTSGSISPISSPEYDPGMFEKCPSKQTPDEMPATEMAPSQTSPISLGSDNSSSANPHCNQPRSQKSKTVSLTSNSRYTAIRCGHLREGVTVEQLRDHFLHCPGLQHAYLPLNRSGRPRNYGMISFEDSLSAQMAQKTLNDQIKFSKTADPLALSAEYIHRITSSSRRLQFVEKMRLQVDTDVPLKKKIAEEERENSSKQRVMNLIAMLDEKDVGFLAASIDKIVEEIDETFHHESEVCRNCRIWVIQFQLFDKAAAEVLIRRKTFEDKHIFKASPDDEQTLIDSRALLLDWVKALVENARKLRLLLKLFNKDHDLPPRSEMSFEMKLRHFRGWIVHDFRSVPNFIIDWDGGYNTLFTYLDELLNFMETFKSGILSIYDDLKKTEQFNGILNGSFIPREWSVLINDKGKQKMLYDSDGESQVDTDVDLEDGSFGSLQYGDGSFMTAGIDDDDTGGNGLYVSNSDDENAEDMVVDEAEDKASDQHILENTDPKVQGIEVEDLEEGEVKELLGKKINVAWIRGFFF